MPPPNSASHGTPDLTPTAPTSHPESESSSQRGSSSRSSHTDSPVPTDDDNIHDENVNFLRSRSLLYSPYHPPETSVSRSRRRRDPTSHPRPVDETDRMDVDDPDHNSNLRLSVEINRRIPIVRRQREDITNTNMPNYETHRSDPRSLYGWAPGSDDEEDPRHGEESDDDQIQPFLHAISDRAASSSRPRRHESTGRTPPIRPGDDHGEGSSRLRTPPLATMEALLHRLVLNLLITSLPIPTFQPWRQYQAAYTYRSACSRICASATSLGSPSDTLLKNTITYLDRLRYSSSFEESISSAAATGFLFENFHWKDSDFILETNTIAPPATCSWLRPGVVFSGCQRAANTGSILSQRLSNTRAPGDPVIVNGGDEPRINVYTTNGRRYLANNREENWPVKVTIHNINHTEMTLSGTMEAYNIPDKTSPTHDAHIVTFLEGEIIDFNQHTLETKNFKADADIDSTYWRELQPFKDLTDSEIAKNLVSRKWITEQLAKGWILMRWKERCFITPTDSRQGLTISGFYYISLRREDGQIEGLYYDPGSSPYQQLSLKPETPKMVRPSYTFR
ncbi:hypothetical protein N7509_002527 [Penicillium cosmopolitanum]|uniref:Vacuolar import and degradation protein-domain-containing protein n=1 Tax=Penicillium cosmopolitanum TaxID=1131564 RepID=A0A9X0BDK1_9EURO|nr:uncharacterized protein N7509_002527 [Penicillium cosmopolitanum]KAJ5408644.1 hypothetical protein N7509_002527 [Penicillium cosmopolitanum]